MMQKLDKIDLEILKILKKNARTPIKVIAEKVFVSSPTVTTRIEAMEKAGVILGYHARVNPSILGSPVRAFINLEVEPEKKEELYAILKKSKEVIECSHVTGEYSVLIKGIFTSTSALEKCIVTLQNYGRTKTQIVFSSVVERPGFSLQNLDLV